jgi:adenylate kinase
MRAFDFDTPTHVFVLDVPLQVSQQRIANRLTCDRCGKVYSTFFGNTAGERCPCGGTMIHREDDQPDIVTKRLEIYDRETSEVIRVFEQRGLVHHVDGTKTPEEVSEALTKFLWTEKLS